MPPDVPTPTPPPDEPASSLPDEVVVSPDGSVAAAPTPVPEPAKTDASSAVTQVTDNIKEGLIDPHKDDQLITGLNGLGGAIKMRLHDGTPMQDVPHPPNAATHLVPAAEQMVDALEGRPADMRPTKLNPKKLRRKVKLLKRARRILGSLKPVTDWLDLLVRNLEQGIDVDLRAAWRRIEALAEEDADLMKALSLVQDYVTLNAKKAAKSRRSNASEAASADQPATPVVVTPTPVPVTPTPVTPSPAPGTPPVVGPRPAGPSRRSTGRRIHRLRR